MSEKTAPQTKDFKLGAILSVTHGIMLTENIGDIYEILNFVTGDNLFTHQLPRASICATPHLLAQHPVLSELNIAGVDGTNWRSWLDAAIARVGETLPITTLPQGAHERIDPISELAEKVHPDQIIVIGDPNGR